MTLREVRCKALNAQGAGALLSTESGDVLGGRLQDSRERVIEHFDIMQDV